MARRPTRAAGWIVLKVSKETKSTLIDLYHITGMTLAEVAEEATKRGTELMKKEIKKS